MICDLKKASSKTFRKQNDGKLDRNGHEDRMVLHLVVLVDSLIVSLNFIIQAYN